MADLGGEPSGEGRSAVHPKQLNEAPSDRAHLDCVAGAQLGVTVDQGDMPTVVPQHYAFTGGPIGDRLILRSDKILVRSPTR